MPDDLSGSRPIRDPGVPMPKPDSVGEELRASVAARRDLGPDYEDALVESFLARLDQSIGARVEAGLEQRAASPGSGESSTQGFILGLVSLGVGVPITAISAGVAETPGLVVAWLGIVGVNVAHALSRRR